MVNKKKYAKNLGVRQKTHDGIDKIMNKVQSMSDKSKDAVARSKEKATKLRRGVDGYIEKNPEKSILFAIGVGLLLGVIFTARMIKKR